jgi:hypothetical protein
MTTQHTADRRNFIKGAAAITAGVAGFGLLPEFAAATPDTDINIIGPKPGYSPQIGTLVSMLTWMQPAVTRAVQGMTRADLDYLFDANANSIGALLLHLAATETYYQFNTFDGMKWDSWSDEIKRKWNPAMDLGDAGRKTIKGHELDFYLDALHEAREKSLAEFRKRDDTWLMAVDQSFPWGPTNNYCKWFDVCEHESHHAGQIDMLKKRLPGAKPDAQQRPYSHCRKGFRLFRAVAGQPLYVFVGSGAAKCFRRIPGLLGESRRDENFGSRPRRRDCKTLVSAFVRNRSKVAAIKRHRPHFSHPSSIRLSCRPHRHPRLSEQ